MASFKGIKQASDNSNDHAYGKRQTQSDDKIHELLKYHFVKPQQSEEFANVEKYFKPQNQNNRLKPPRNTVASKLRLKAI
jgi:hypothetical protein